uniref:Mediator of RNA polymerase II transcription subunit 13 n=1 Tax=Mesocestoides corti TaxID=53468 RepID=A0A5K3FC56_MESCO
MPVEYSPSIYKYQKIFRVLDLLYELHLSPPADSSTSHWPDWSKFANPEAACTLVTQPDVFENRARSYVENHSLWSSTDSSSLESSSSSSPLSVLGWQNDSFVAMIREKIANSSQPFKNCPCCSDAGCRGYSWIDPDNMTLFSPMRLCNGKPD